MKKSPAPLARLTLEFIPQRPVPWFGLLFLLLALAGSASLVRTWWRAQAEVEVNQARVATLNAALKAKQRSELAARADDNTAAKLQRLQAQKVVLASINYSWNRVLSVLEQNDANDVAVLSFAHDQAGVDVKLAVEALDVPALIRFVDKLNEGEAESRWYLANYQMQPQNNPATVKGNILNR